MAKNIMALKHNPVRLFSLSTMALLAAGASQAAPPTCSSTEFDSDNDGWGWENHRSCKVAVGTEVQVQSPDPDEATDTTPSYMDRHPICTGSNPDPDGNGWGWENHRSCYVLTDSTDVTTTDDDNEESVPVVVNDEDAESTNTDEPVDSRHPVCELASSDPDGDGWGWENSRSCIAGVTDNEIAEPDSDDAESDETDPPTEVEPEPEKNDAPVVYKQDFESAENGLYQSDQLNEGWNQPFWHLGFDQGRVKIVSDAGSGKIMQVTFPAGAYGSNGASAFLSDVQFGMELPKTYDELYLSYDIMFADDFEFVQGGKLPGLCGANSDSALTEGCNTGGGKPNGFDGWSARGMWRVDGALEHYTYHAGQENYWADSLLWNVKAKRGSWHRVQHRVVLNTVGASDGILEAWIDGQKVLSNKQLEYRKTESVGINLFYFSTFFGGNDPSWAPKTDQIMYFDNFIISTEQTN